MCVHILNVNLWWVKFYTEIVFMKKKIRKKNSEKFSEFFFRKIFRKKKFFWKNKKTVFKLAIVEYLCKISTQLIKRCGREPPDKQTHTQTDRHTDRHTNRHLLLSHPQRKGRFAQLDNSPQAGGAKLGDT